MRSQAFYNEDRDGQGDYRLMGLYLRYAFYRTAQRILPGRSAYAERADRLRAAIDEARAIRLSK